MDGGIAIIFKYFFAKKYIKLSWKVSSDEVLKAG